jgi:hypothetical protein
MPEKERNDTRKGFTGMPNGAPFPNFEPENSKEKQIEQFEDTAMNGKTTK